MDFFFYKVGGTYHFISCRALNSVSIGNPFNVIVKGKPPERGPGFSVKTRPLPTLCRSFFFFFTKGERFYSFFFFFSSLFKYNVRQGASARRYRLANFRISATLFIVDNEGQRQPAIPPSVTVAVYAV